MKLLSARWLVFVAALHLSEVYRSVKWVYCLVAQELRFYRVGRGIKASLDSITLAQIEILKQAVDQNPQSLRSVAVVLSATFGFKVTDYMVLRYLKKTQL